MRKIVLLIFLVIFFSLYYFSAGIATKANATVEPCRADGTNCTRCHVDNNTCAVWESQSTCSTSGYEPDPEICVIGSANGPSDLTQCDGPSGAGWAGSCKESDTPLPQDQGFKYVGSVVDPNICIICNRGLPDNERDNSICIHDTKQACLDHETGTSRYKCVKNTGCVECSDSEKDSPDCKVRNRCEESCTEKSTPRPNTPLSQPCTDADPMWGCLKIHTALGDVDTQAPEFVRWVLSFVLGISGAIVLIIIIITGYRLMTSQGDPEKVKNARDQLTAAIVGLLFIIFSLVILQFITVNVLQLPGFGG